MNTSQDENVIVVEFNGKTKVTTPTLYQYDTGQILKVLDIKDGVEVQFSNDNSDTTTNRIVENGQVEIPDFLIAEGLEITAEATISQGGFPFTLSTAAVTAETSPVRKTVAWPPHFVCHVRKETSEVFSI